MKLRIYVVFDPEQGWPLTNTDYDVAVLLENDSFHWVGSLGIINTTAHNAYHHAKQKEQRVDGVEAIASDTCSIAAHETIHIVGDFDSADEYMQWAKMHDVLGTFDTIDISTLTK